MTEDAFVLDPRLAEDSFHISTIDGCQIRLMDDARFPWVMLVPEVGGVSELFDLNPANIQRVMSLAIRLGEDMKSRFGADKINIANLGNVVSQLHIHVIARTHNDAAWPGPVWGVGTRLPLSDEEKRKRIHQLRMSIGSLTASTGAL